MQTNQFLDGEGWVITNGTTVVQGTVPGTSLTDLQLSGVIGDPIFNLNFQGNVWDSSVWNYTTSFDLAPGVGGGAVFLVADGIEMVADIVVINGRVGWDIRVADQFLRSRAGRGVHR